MPKIDRKSIKNIWKQKYFIKLKDDFKKSIEFYNIEENNYLYKRVQLPFRLAVALPVKVWFKKRATPGFIIVGATA